MKHTESLKFIRLAALVVILLAASSCISRLRVGELQNESQSVALGDAESVQVEISMGAGELDVTGGAQELLEAEFTYNVDELTPEVEYTDGVLVVRQPERSGGLPALTGLSGYRNEWNLSLNDEVPMEMKVDVGAGITNLQLAGLSLSGLDVSVGAGETTVDLSGDWASDFNATIDAGAGQVRLRLPSEVGVRVVVDAGVGEIEAPGLTKDGNAYTNAAYGTSDVTLQIDIQAGIGKVILEG